MGLALWSSQAAALVCTEPVASPSTSINLGFFFLLSLVALLLGYGIKGFLFRKFMKRGYLDYFFKVGLAAMVGVLAIIWALNSVTLEHPNRSIGFAFLVFAISFSVIDHMYLTKRGLDEDVFRVRSIISSVVLALVLAMICYLPYTVGTTGNCKAG